MAWRCTGSTNTELIENMARSKLINDDAVKQAFLKVRTQSHMAVDISLFSRNKARSELT
jgi:hypothetical protein